MSTRNAYNNPINQLSNITNDNNTKSLLDSYFIFDRINQPTSFIQNRSQLTQEIKLTNNKNNKSFSQLPVSNKDSSFYSKSKEMKRNHDMRIDLQKCYYAQIEINKLKPHPQVNHISRIMNQAKAKRSNSNTSPNIYERNTKKINLTNTRNLKKLIAEESTEIIQKKYNHHSFSKWLDNNTRWKQNTMKKYERKMIELEDKETEEDFIYQPQINTFSRFLIMKKEQRELNRTYSASSLKIHPMKTGNQFYNNNNDNDTSISSHTKVLRKSYSSSNLKKEYDKVKEAPSFNPTTNYGNKFNNHRANIHRKIIQQSNVTEKNHRRPQSELFKLVFHKPVINKALNNPRNSRQYEYHNDVTPMGINKLLFPNDGDKGVNQKIDQEKDQQQEKEKEQQQEQGQEKQEEQQVKKDLEGSYFHSINISNNKENETMTNQSNSNTNGLYLLNVREKLRNEIPMNVVVIK